jgi:hypothetical protein
MPNGTISISLHHRGYADTISNQGDKIQSLRMPTSHQEILDAEFANATMLYVDGSDNNLKKSGGSPK